MTLDDMREEYNLLCSAIKELKAKLFRLNLDKMTLANRMTRELFGKPDVSTACDLANWVRHTQQAAQARYASLTPNEHHTPSG